MKRGALKAVDGIGAFIIDYLQRHRHPVNAALHIMCVPAVFYGLFCAAAGRSQKERSLGLGLIVFGYVLQYLGHKKQGNEVGEVSLIKYLIAKIREAARHRLSNFQWPSTAESDADKGSADVLKNNHNGNGNGNGHHGKNGGSSSADGRYILWWKTSH